MTKQQKAKSESIPEEKSKRKSTKKTAEKKVEKLAKTPLPKPNDLPDLPTTNKVSKSMPETGKLETTTTNDLKQPEKPTIAKDHKPGDDIFLVSGRNEMKPRHWKDGKPV